jgi:hypothetical protein
MKMETKTKETTKISKEKAEKLKKLKQKLANEGKLINK